LRPPDEAVRTFRTRQARVAAWLARAGIHACVLDDWENGRSSSVRWLCGHPTDAFLFLFANGKTVLVPWDVTMANERSVTDLVIPYAEFKRSWLEVMTGILRKNGIDTAAEKKIELPGRTSWLRWKELGDALPGVQILLRADGFESFIGEVRLQKDAAEIAAIEKAAGITDTIIELIIKRLSPPGGADGLREFDMAQLVEREALSLGAESIGFETLAAGPGRSWAIHPFPACSGGPFATEGLSILDFGVKVDGYSSDVTLTMARGRLTAEQERMISLVEEAYGAATRAVGPGVSPREVAVKVEDIFTAGGWKMPHGLGHGLGLDVHEAPTLRSQGDAIDPALLPGMVFTIEPGLYHPEHGGVRWENDVLITESSARILTHARIVRMP
jgi:Xaa-Pro aminopeptidase